MKKWFFNVAFLVGLFTNVQANTPEAAVLPAHSMMKAQFVQNRYLSGVPMPIISKGNLTLAEGRGLVWDTLTPFPSTLIITKKGLFQWDGQTKAPVIKGGDKAIFEVMGQIFNVAPGKTIPGFTLEKVPAKKKFWSLRLVPGHPQVTNFIKCIIITGGKYITHISIQRPNGDHDEIDILSHKIEPKVTSDMEVLLND